MTQFDQLESNVRLLTDITLTEQDRNDLLLASAEPGLYCSGCNKCSGRCQKGLFIPDLMRAYMYAYGYGNPLEAQILLAGLGYGKDPCGDCTECSVECGKGFRIREKIADVSRLIEVPSEFLA
jgi:predicted aldo/keto reductase-like oxidoreductase